MAENSPIVYLVDDEPAVARALARLLRFSGFSTSTYNSPADFLAEHDPERPGCIVLDLSMPGMSGLALQKMLAERKLAAPPHPIVFLTGRADVPTSVEAMKSGAVDFLTKPVDDRTLIEAVRSAIERDRQARAERHANRNSFERLATLTPREREVLAQVATGRLNKQIAQELGTTEKTIKVHRARVMSKMGAASLADLVRIADRCGVRP